MTAKPRLLDLFSGAGGCARGYQRAGFYVVGVDNRPQPRYAGDEFWQRDALDVLRDGALIREDENSYGGWALYDFDAIHASPPCQDYSKAMRHLAAPQPRLIDPVRDLLAATGLPWVLENVPGAPIPTQWTLDGRYGVELCGTMFGLPVRRHRLFETNFPVNPQRGCDHRLPAMNPYNQLGRDRIYAALGRQNPDPVWNAAMGVPWMDKHEGREANPARLHGADRPPTARPHSRREGRMRSNRCPGP